MADDNALELIKRGDLRFSRRQQLDGLREEIALQFAPWLAGWTSELVMGSDFCSHLVDGTPILLARDFKSQVGAMLRPPGKQYFWHRTPHDDINNDRDARDYLDWRSRQMLRILSDPITNSARALEQADAFFAYFGDAVISVDYGRLHDSLRLASHHTKDCVWAVGEYSRVDVITRREQVPARVIAARYGTEKLSEQIKTALDKDPDQTFEIRHEVLPADEYDGYAAREMRRQGGQFASIWIDVQSRTVLRESTQRTFRYVVPRWVTLPNWAYAISPATTIALPDARLIQEQALAILEAAEKQVNPPLLAYTDTVRGAVDLKPRGITWVDRGYDERTGVPVQPLELGKHFRLGVEALLRTEAQLTRAFFLDVLRMPDTRNSKSTVEVQFKIDEYVRAALPLFAPMQAEYNEQLLREVDEMIDLAGGYKRREMPEILRDEALQFAWDNPLTEMMERAKLQGVAEIGNIGQALAGLEAAAAQAPALKAFNGEKAFRESVISIGQPGWLYSEREARALAEDAARQMQMQQLMAAAPDLARTIDSGVSAAKTAAEIPQSDLGIALMPEPV